MIFSFSDLLVNISVFYRSLPHKRRFVKLPPAGRGKRSRPLPSSSFLPGRSDNLEVVDCTAFVWYTDVMLCHIHSDASCVVRERGGTAPMRIGYVITNTSGRTVARCGMHVTGFQGEPTGTINQAEYIALIEALRHAFRLGFTEAKCIVDSQLLARQCSGAYKVKDVKLARLLRELNEIGRMFRSVEIEWTPRNGNTEADSLTHQSVFEEPAVISQRGAGRRPRSLPAWLAARARRLVDENLALRGSFNASVLTRLLRLDHTGLRQLLRGETYRDAREDGVPDWNTWTGELHASDTGTTEIPGAAEGAEGSDGGSVHPVEAAD